MATRRKPLTPKASVSKNGRRRYGTGGKLSKGNCFKCGGKTKK